MVLFKNGTDDFFVFRLNCGDQFLIGHTDFIFEYPPDQCPKRCFYIYDCKEDEGFYIRKDVFDLIFRKNIANTI